MIIQMEIVIHNVTSKILFDAALLLMLMLLLLVPSDMAALISPANCEKNQCEREKKTSLGKKRSYHQ